MGRTLGKVREEAVAVPAGQLLLQGRDERRADRILRVREALPGTTGHAGLADGDVDPLAVAVHGLDLLGDDVLADLLAAHRALAVAEAVGHDVRDLLGAGEDLPELRA